MYILYSILYYKSNVKNTKSMVVDNTDNDVEAYNI